MTTGGGVELYDPTTNAWTDITPSIAGLGTGTFSTIQGFNDTGQFVGLVQPPQGGGVFGYVVSPVPEPSSLLLAIVACGGALFPHRITKRSFRIMKRTVVARPSVVSMQTTAARTTVHFGHTF